MILYETKTAAQAVCHFMEHGFKALWPKQRKMSNPEYAWALKIIQDARSGSVSEKRAKALLEKYGGEQYRVTTSFEVAITHSNGPAFKAALEKFWAENEGEETETKNT